MDKVDQRRFDNQASTHLTAAEAAELLGVRRATLYAYVSRGLVSTVREPRGAARYLRSDVERLKARHDARAGHAAVAAGALRWGEPVLESALTAIDARGPLYRGHPAVELARSGIGYEAVAELLWTDGFPVDRPSWGTPDLGYSAVRAAALLPEGAHPLLRLAIAVTAMAARDPGRHGAPRELELQRARALVLRLAASLGLDGNGERARQAIGAGSVARAALVGLGARATAERVDALDRALILLADHELNVSTFAARIAASAGADLYACVAAALAVVTGPRHGGACDRVEALVAEVAQPARAASVVQARLARGEAVPGFGHPLYPDGDPRAPSLLELANRLASRDRVVRTLVAIIDAMRAAGHAHVTVDPGLVAIAAALGLPSGSAAALFALGRSAGWIAHSLEQRASGHLLRPRARYIGR